MLGVFLVPEDFADERSDCDHHHDEEAATSLLMRVSVLDRREVNGEGEGTYCHFGFEGRKCRQMRSKKEGVCL